MKLKYYFISYDPVPIPQFLSIGCSADPRETRFGPARRNEYLIHYVISGQGYFNGHLVTGGQGFLITPGMAEYYYPDETDPWKYLWFISRDPAMDFFFAQHMSNPQTGIFSYENPVVTEQIYQWLTLKTAPFGFSSTQIAEYFLRIYNQCISASFSPKASNEKLYLDHAIQLIHSALSTAITVDFLCEKLGVSQPYLYKVFQRNLNCSPKQYILQCKLSHAQTLLQESDLPISEVGAAVGFGDRLAFSRFFSAKTGCSPTQYRRQLIDKPSKKHTGSHEYD